MCCHRVSTSQDAHDWLGSSSERRPGPKCQAELVRDPEEDWSEDTLMGEHASSEESQMVWRNCQNFTTLQNALYLCSMPKGENENLLLFMASKAYWIATLNGCHWDAGHQGHDHTLSLLQECFWWLGMAKQTRQSNRACTCCLQY